MVRNTDGQRGQIGIETLIGFIALVAIAALAAAVLINTANILQDTAEQAGLESVSEVADRVEVTEQLGDTDVNGEVDNVRLQVSISSGADQVDLTETQISFVGDSDTLLTYTNSDDPAADEFTVKALSDKSGDLSGDRPVLSERADVAEIEIELGLEVEEYNETFSSPSSGDVIVVSERTPVQSIVNATDTNDSSSVNVSIQDAENGEILVEDDVTGDLNLTYEAGIDGPNKLVERDEVDVELRTGGGAETQTKLLTPSPLETQSTIVFE